MTARKLRVLPVFVRTCLRRARGSDLLLERKKRFDNRVLPIVGVVALVKGIHEQCKVECHLKRHRASFLETRKFRELYNPVK